MLSEIELKLLEDPHVQFIEHDGPWNLPEVSLDLWQEVRRRSILNALGSLKRMLDLPYIVDDFEQDHGQRTAWWNAMERNVREYALQTVLRGNHLNNLNYVCILSARYQGTGSEEFQSRCERIFKFPRGEAYWLLPTSEKVSAVRKVKMEIAELIRFLSQQQPSA
jgi:hypothetical protein